MRDGDVPAVAMLSGMGFQRPSALTVGLVAVAGGAAYLAYDYVKCVHNRTAVREYAPVFRQVRKAVEEAERTLSSTPDPSQSEGTDAAFDRDLLEMADPQPLLFHSEVSARAACIYRQTVASVCFWD